MDNPTQLEVCTCFPVNFRFFANVCVFLPFLISYYVSLRSYFRVVMSISISAWKRCSVRQTQYVLETTMHKQTQITQIRHGASYKEMELKTNRTSFPCYHVTTAVPRATTSTNTVGGMHMFSGEF
jgi:hypothetical protein